MDQAYLVADNVQLRYWRYTVSVIEIHLKATNIAVGLLLTFGRKPEFKRFIFDNTRKRISDNQRKSVAKERGRINFPK
jgi:hypothetical protein